MKSFEKIVQKLIKNKKTIATMESCTGGSLASAITNVEGASAVFKFGAVTYSNDFKIKMGVNKKTIDEYSVYSINTAREMAFSISRYAIADIGVGVTGKMGVSDPNNNFGDDSRVFVCIYYDDEYYDLILKVNKGTRMEKKDYIIDKVIEFLDGNLKL